MKTIKISDFDCAMTGKEITRFSFEPFSLIAFTMCVVSKQTRGSFSLYYMCKYFIKNDIVDYVINGVTSFVIKINSEAYIIARFGILTNILVY